MRFRRLRAKETSPPLPHLGMDAVTRFGCAVVFTLLSGVAAAAEPAERIAQFRINPQSVRLAGPSSRFSLLVDGQTVSGRSVDLTRQALFSSSSPEIASVSPRGVVKAVGDGRTVITVTVAGQKREVPVVVTGTQIPRRFHFENDIEPLLTRFGCNAAGCHGKAEGQNGFKLSVFGFQPDDDFAALRKENRGRRVNAAIPERSLLLMKASGGVPHGGGIRIRRGSGDYRLLRDWIRAGAPHGDREAAHVVSIEVTPRERQLTAGATQQLRVVATYSDGNTFDVTGHAKFQSNNERLAKVDEFGLVTVGESPGEVAVMTSYMGPVDVFRTLIPRTPSIENYPDLPANNFVDRLVNAKLKKLNILPSGAADDPAFLRRVSLDIIGTLPTADEVRDFLADKRENRRALLVDSLLQRPEYADYRALKWADLLRVDRLKLGHKRAYSFYRWIRESFSDNKPFDRFATELLTAQGPLEEQPAGQFYKVVSDPGEMAATLSQVLLGVRIQCAQCHHHPFDRWSQTDYFGMQAFFTQVTFKGAPQGEMILPTKNAPTKHPRTGDLVFAHPLATTAPEQSPPGDRRLVLADWLTAPDNGWFAKNIVNRAWAHFLGRGLVEPVDDVRLTNPPSNPELLDALARDFVDHGYDYHQLIRNITATRAYQRSSKPNETNQLDEQNYSRFLFKRMDAEVLYDAVLQTTGVAEKFQGVPAGYRAIQLWDSQVPHYFLKLFGRPMRATACTCERTGSPTVGQVLHVMNSPQIQKKLSHAGGRIAKLARDISDDDAVVEELYLTFFSRLPTQTEREAVRGHLKGKADAERRQATEDIAWSMLNSLEFLFNH